MKIFGLPIPFSASRREKALGRPSMGRGGWLPVIRDHYPGAWQRNDEIDADSALTHHTVFACCTLIASDIAKLRLTLRSEEHTSELQSRGHLVCRLLLEKKKHK